MANGEGTLFWSGHWVGGNILKNRLVQLFSISSNKEATMVDLRRGASRSRTCDWDFRWRRKLFEWETELLQHLLTEFGTITFREDRRDDIVWMHDPWNCFYVKLAYKVLTEESNQVVQTFKTKLWHKHVL